jgi:hypothetical protein
MILIGADELDFWRRVASGLLTLDAATLKTLMAEREVMEVNNGLVPRFVITVTYYEIVSFDPARRYET